MLAVTNPTVAKILRTYIKFYVKYPVYFGLFVVSILVLSAAESVQPYFYKLFVDAIPEAQLPRLFTLLVLFILFRLLIVLSNSITYLIADVLLIRCSQDARIRVVGHIHTLDFSYHTKKSTGSMISLIRRGDNAFFSLFHAGMDIIRVCVIFVVSALYFSVFNAKIALLVVCAFVLNSILTKLLISHNIKTRKAFNNSEDAISSVIVDNLINYETVKLFAKETWELNRLKKTFKVWAKTLWRYSNSFRLFDLGVGLPANLFLFLILLVGISDLVRGTIQAGDFMLILAFINSFYWRFFDLLYGFREIAKNYTDLEKYLSIFSQTIQVKDPKSPKRLPLVRGEITFTDVHFAYPNTRNKALCGLNLHIREGQSIALVGRSGSGKSTIVKLLLRFFDPQKGRVTLDGINIKALTKSQLRSFIGIVPQEPILFNNSIKFNIAYGKPHATNQEIEAAAKLANIHTFIMSLPGKYQTSVGERGIKLSGGQKQRLAIARMVLANPDVIVFDEATSQLDSESEKLIQEAFWKVTQNKTTIIVAHRLSTVMRADKIAVLDDGRIIELGSHRALLHKHDSLYRHFWQLQSKPLEGIGIQ